jgi:hypothetical protein
VKAVYDAANALEAHMVAGMLEQVGIAAHVAGEHLQGGAGELPAAGLVRILVADEDHERAREVIVEWERAQPAPGAPAAAPSSAARRRPWTFLLAGLVAGGLLAWIVLSKPEPAEIDFNGDGISDVIDVYRQGVIERSDVDRNSDGRPDEVLDFDSRGFVRERRADDDFNGVFESRTEFELGQPVAWTLDYDQDGVVDGRGRMPTPAVTYEEMLDPAGTAVIRRQRWCLGRLQAELVDTNHDGRLDTARLYTPQGDLEGSNADLETAMSRDGPGKSR